MVEGGFLRQFDALCQSLLGLLGLHGRFGGLGGKVLICCPILIAAVGSRCKPSFFAVYSFRTNLRCTVSKGEKNANCNVFSRVFILYVLYFFYLIKAINQ